MSRAPTSAWLAATALLLAGAIATAIDAWLAHQALAAAAAGAFAVPWIVQKFVVPAEDARNDPPWPIAIALPAALGVTTIAVGALGLAALGRASFHAPSASILSALLTLVRAVLFATRDAWLVGAVPAIAWRHSASLRVRMGIALLFGAALAMGHWPDWPARTWLGRGLLGMALQTVWIRDGGAKMAISARAGIYAAASLGTSVGLVRIEGAERLPAAENLLRHPVILAVVALAAAFALWRWPVGHSIDRAKGLGSTARKR